MLLKDAVSKDILEHLKSKGFSQTDDVNGHPKIKHRHLAEKNANLVSDITPLMRLCADNKIEGVRQLLSAKADPTCEIPNLTLTRKKMKKKVRLKSVTAHVLSAIYKRYECLDLLFQAPYNEKLNEKGKHFCNAIWNATKYNRPKVIKYIFSKYQFTYSLYKFGKPDYISKDYPEAPEKGKLPKGFAFRVTALERSIMDGSLYCMHELLSCNLDTDSAVRTRLDQSVDYSIRQKFSEPNHTNRSGITPLKLAIKYSKHDPKTKYEIVQLLLKYKANVNDAGASSKHSDGCTPLHYAVEINDLPLIKLLLEHGARFNIRNKKGQTPVQVAVEKHGATIVNQFLLQSTGWDLEEWDLSVPGVNLNCTNEKGQTPLHVLIEVFRLDNARVLVVKGANVNVQDLQGTTPLHLAISTNDLSFTRFLLSRGARLDIANKKGQTPLQQAMNDLQTDMFSLLLHFMAFLPSDNLEQSFLPLEYIRSAFELAPPVHQPGFLSSLFSSKPKELDEQAKIEQEKRKALSDLLIKEFQYHFYLNVLTKNPFTNDTLRAHILSGLSDQDKSNRALIKFVDQNFQLTTIKREMNLRLFRMAYRIMKACAAASPDIITLKVGNVSYKIGCLNVGVVKIILSFIENSHVLANQHAMFTNVSQKVIGRAKNSFYNEKRMILHGKMLTDTRKSDDSKTASTGLVQGNKEGDKQASIGEVALEDAQLKNKTGLTKRKGVVRI